MKTLNLTLKKKWFDMIASGEKKEEYREIKPYWIKRLANNLFKKQPTTAIEFIEWFNNMPKFVTLHHVTNQFQTITFSNGYSKNAPTIVFEFKGIDVGKARPEWSDNWQGDVFIIKLGDRL